MRGLWLFGHSIAKYSAFLLDETGRTSGQDMGALGVQNVHSWGIFQWTAIIVSLLVEWDTMDNDVRREVESHCGIGNTMLWGHYSY